VNFARSARHGEAVVGALLTTSDVSRHLGVNRSCYLQGGLGGSKQEAWFPLSEAVVFRPDEARVSAKLYRSVSRARGREVDLAIAVCAMVNNAFVWTLNSKDFADIPNLRLLP